MELYDLMIPSTTMIAAKLYAHIFLVYLGGTIAVLLLVYMIVLYIRRKRLSP